MLVNLPVRTPVERAWSMRLGASLVEIASGAFEIVDLGDAPPPSWRLLESGEAEEKIGGAAYLPAALMQLLVWLSRRVDAAEARDAEEASAAANLRRVLELPGAQSLARQVPAPQPELTRLWEGRAEVLLME